MKITYESATETIEIEVSERWGNLIKEMDREEARVDRKETRRHEGLNLLSYCYHKEKRRYRAMKKTRIGLSDDEVRIIVLSLVELRNALIQEEEILKVAHRTFSEVE